MAILMVLVPLVRFAVLGQHDNPAATVLLNFIAFLLAVWLLVLAAYFPTMRYELGDRELGIFFGPFIAWRIPVSSIRDVRTETLAPAFRASTRMPGIALFSVLYHRVGKVRMCSTRTIRDVVLLETDGGYYGISPADDELFISQLRGRMDLQRP